MTALAGNWAMHVAHLLWQATLAGIVVLAASRLLAGRSSHFRHALILLAALKFVLPPMLPLPVGLFSAAPPVPELTAIRNGISGAGPSLLVVLMLVHAAGSVVALTRLALAAWRLRRIVRRAVPIGEGVRISGEVAVPMAVGLFNPAILIPLDLARSLPREELADVIAHEIEHVRRGDVTLNVLQAIVSGLWWFHPLVYLLEREGRALREERCDDSLLGAGLTTPARYARTLLHAASSTASRPPFAAAAIAESRGSLLRRVRRMADARFAPRPRLGRGALVVVLLAALLLLPGLRVSRANRIAFDHATRHALHHH